jgi:hypothetical protein
MTFAPTFGTGKSAAHEALVATIPHVELSGAEADGFVRATRIRDAASTEEFDSASA